MRYLDFDRYDRDQLKSMAEKFSSAEPFPHLVLENTITADAQDVIAGFPDLHWSGWLVQKDTYQKGKRSCSDIENIPAVPKAILQELQEPTCLKVLEAISGIEKLLIDPYLAGGGLHCTGPGGRLSPHIDFHYYKALSLYRRLNLLLYLNPAWKDVQGGQLQLFRKGESTPRVSVAPRFGTCVIFMTDDQSVHGVSPVATESDMRRSIAVYYYTSSDTATFSGGTATYWQDIGSVDVSRVQRLRLVATKGLVGASRAFAKLSHIIDPNIESP